MADYYSHNDPKKKGHDQYYDSYGSGSGANWIWALIVLVAIVALIALGSTGGGGGTETGATAVPTAPEAPAVTAAPTVTE